MAWSAAVCAALLSCATAKGPSGNVISTSRTDRWGVALLKLPGGNVAVKYVIAEPFPTVIVGARWYPTLSQYYIEFCGGSIP